ncbi:hypothetical protein ABC337_12710 [Arthrobacter sp. 1P04PC]|uniref:restriction endonuclease subunit S n=1 Tax=unclassified Arthrobacter TaxID=235627 RepID=UPI0039A39CEF
MFCRIDTQNGPFAVVPRELEGALVSNEFPLYKVDAEAFHPRFLALCFLRRSVLRGIGSARNGRDGRARWKESDFVMQLVPKPPLAVQRRIINVIAAVDEAIDTLDDEAVALIKLMAAVRQSLLADAPSKPLGDLCAISAKLVDPRLPEHAELPHMGVDAIEKSTGRLLPMRSAKEDGVISGKFLVSPGQVVLSKVRPALRKACTPDVPVLCSADAYPLAPADGVHPGVLREVLLEDSFTAQVVMASDRAKMPKFNRKQLFTTSVKWPEDENDRERVVASTDAIRVQIQAVADERDRLGTVREDLLENLLKGEIHVLPADGVPADSRGVLSP